MINLPDPEIIIFAPALATCSTLSIVILPSTPISRSLNYFLKYSIFGIISAMNFYPPKPGSNINIVNYCYYYNYLPTVITNT